MRKIREVLRLKHEAGLSTRQIAACTRMGRTTVIDYLRRVEQAGLDWPLDEKLSDEALERLLFPPLAVGRARDEPDWAALDAELRRKGVTLMLLWQEYKANHPEGYQYSRFCERYRLWKNSVDLVMRQHHRVGEKLFVDYAGQTVPVIDPTTGEERQAQVFVAVLGASNYTYAEATWTQALPDWLASHRRTFDYLGGTPAVVVPDNLKSGVTKAHRYEPELNRSYADLAAHYSVAVIPARLRKPRDKAKVEAGVLLVERWILARLRNRRFLSLEELNEAIDELLERLNERPFQKMDGSRRSVFEAIERPALRPLPAEPYVFAEWKKARVSIDYHLEIEGHYYSVPFRHAREQVDVRLSAATIEVFSGGQRVASHRRAAHRGRHTTLSEHMPESHRRHAEWSPRRIIAWAAKTGPATEALVEHILTARPHPEQGYRSCLGVLRLGNAYGEERLEAAARRGVAIGATSYKSIASILKSGLDQQPLPEEESTTVREPSRPHANIRGAAYYASVRTTSPAGHGPSESC
jgi:transposase